MSASFNIETYREPLLFFATAGIVVPLFRRLRISPVIGFLAAGVMLGPYALGLVAKTHPWLAWFAIQDVDHVAEIGEIGVAFLLFMIGLELSWERLVRMRRLVFGLGAWQVVASTAILSALVRATMDFGISQSVLVGAALAMSSTAIVIPVLAEARRLNRAVGRTTFAVLLFQDLMVAPLLFLVSLLGRRGSDAGWLDLLAGWAPALLALGGLVLAGRLLLRPLFHLVAAARSTELFMATSLFVVVGTGVASAAAGLSMGLGAFIAGLLLAETEYRREIEVTIEPFKGLLLGLFFVSTGAGLDIGRLFAHLGPILQTAFALVIIKAAIFYVLARAFRLGPPLAGEAALLLAPGGEFAFLMITAAVVAKVLPAEPAADLMISVTLTMLTIPVLGWVGARLGPARRQSVIDAEYPELQPAMDVAAERVLIVGYGRVGALVGDMLTRHDIPFVAVDGSANLVRDAREKGIDIYFGNATRPELLQKCGIARAKALVVTMDAPLAVEDVVRNAREQRPDLTIVARARDAAHATHLYELGVSDAIPETIEASLQLAEAVLVDIGVPMGFVIASIHEKRDEYRAILQPKQGEATARRAIKMSTRVKKLGQRKSVPPAKP